MWFPVWFSVWHSTWFSMWFWLPFSLKFPFRLVFRLSVLRMQSRTAQAHSSSEFSRLITEKERVCYRCRISCNGALGWTGTGIWPGWVHTMIHIINRKPVPQFQYAEETHCQERSKKTQRDNYTLIASVAFIRLSLLSSCRLTAQKIFSINWQWSGLKVNIFELVHSLRR